MCVVYGRVLVLVKDVVDVDFLIFRGRCKGQSALPGRLHNTLSQFHVRRQERIRYYCAMMYYYYPALAQRESAISSLRRRCG